jgi:hypothetical protein
MTYLIIPIHLKIKFFGKIIIIQNSIPDTDFKSSLWKKRVTFVKNKYICDLIIKLLISNQDPIGKFKVIV